MPTPCPFYFTEKKMPLPAEFVFAAQEMRLRQKHEISRTTKIFFIYALILKLKFHGLVLWRYSRIFQKEELRKE
jgi:hypothetical protein